MDKAALIEAMKGLTLQEKSAIINELRTADGWWRRNKWWIGATGAIIVSTLLAVFLTRYFFIKGDDSK